MSGETSLKDENAWLIRGVLAVHFVAFAFVASKFGGLGDDPNLAGLLERAENLIQPGSLSLAMIILAKLWLLGLVSPGLRDKLIHWRRNHPLPGARAFTDIAPSSSRVDIEALKVSHGPLPADPQEQNRHFYRLYRQHREQVAVRDPHRSYLATRDIGTINLLLAFLLPGPAFWATGSIALTALYTGALFLAYALTAIASQRYGERFVENTLAVAATSASDPS